MNLIFIFNRASDAFIRKLAKKEAYISLVVNFIFIFNRGSDYLCLYNQLFAQFHYVFKFLTP